MSATANKALQIGDVMPEGHEHAGWVYGGISKTISKPFYIAPRDSGVMRWEEAMEFAARTGASLPSCVELHQIYEARNEGALKGTFNTTGSYPAGWYWSSSQLGSHAWTPRFSDGNRGSYFSRNRESSLRCVRS